MAVGTVKWFDQKKGYGFVCPDEGGKDIFVHISAVEAAGLQTLKPDQRITYDLAENKGRMCAVNLKVQ